MHGYGVRLDFRVTLPEPSNWLLLGEYLTGSQPFFGKFMHQLSGGFRVYRHGDALEPSEFYLV
jgi:hypothetical protein